MKILDLITRYNIEVIKQGNLYVAFCPFHRDENRPNFTVYPATDSYFCYTCSKGGDAIAFLANIENISREQATFKLYSNLSYLIDKLNKEPEEPAYNDAVAIQVAPHFRTYLYNNPTKLSAVKKIMEDVDKKLSQNLSRKEAIDVVANVSERLNNV